MTLATDWAPQSEDNAREIVAMAFRDDHSAERVILSNLSFEGCQLASTREFGIGERLRLNVRGQGWIVARVQSVSGGLSNMVFVTQCAV